MSDSDCQIVKRFDPFAERVVSAEETEYREREYPDDKHFLKKRNVECTSCSKELRKSIVNDYKLCIHPALDVIICRNCEEFYSNGDFSVDEDGSDKYCRWCGQGGNLYLCSDCSVAICAKCVKRNLPKTYNKEIERDDWRCFTCDPKPIWSYRALCAAAKSYVDKHKTTQRPKRLRKFDTEDDSDEEVFVKNTKKSRRDSPSDDQNETRDKRRKKFEEDSEEKDESRKARRGNVEYGKPFSISLSKTKIPKKTVVIDSDSEESSSTSPVKKKKQVVLDSEESSATSSVPSTSRSRRAKKLITVVPFRKNPSRKCQEEYDSDESSSASPVKKNPSRKYQENDSDESSSTSPVKKKESRSRPKRSDSEDLKEKTMKGRQKSRRENLDSENSLPPTPSKKKGSKAFSTATRSKTEKNFLFLLYKDTIKDVHKFSKVVVKNANAFEREFLVKMESSDSEKSSRARNKLEQLLQDIKESTEVLQNSFLKGLKSFDDEKVVNGDHVTNAVEVDETSNALNGKEPHVVDDDEKMDVSDSAKDGKTENLTEETLPEGLSMEDSETKETPDSKKVSDAETEIDDSSEKNRNTGEKSVEPNDNKDVEPEKEKQKSSEESFNENADEESIMNASTEVNVAQEPSPFSTPNVSNMDDSRDVVDDVSENSTTAAELTKPDPLNEGKKDLDDHENNCQSMGEMSDDVSVNKSTNENQESESNSLNSSRLSDTEDNTKNESDIDVLKSDTDKVEAV